MPPSVSGDHGLCPPARSRRGRRSSSTIPCLIVPARDALAWSTSICSRSTPPGRRRDQRKGGPIGERGRPRRRTRGRTTSDYELFNCNNLNICYRSWNYRGCWHQTCPPIDPDASLCVTLTPNAGPRQRGPASLVLVTTSLE